MPVGLNQQVPELLLFKETALLQFCHSPGEGEIAELGEQAVQFDDLVGGERVEEVLADEEVEVTESGGLEVPVLGELFSLEDRVLHLAVDLSGFSPALLHELLVLDVQDFAVLLSDVLEYLVEHHHVELDFDLAGVRVVVLLAVLEALEVVAVGLFELRVLQQQFGEEEVVVVDAFVVDLDVLVDLDGLLRVLDGFLVVGEFPLANGEVEERVDQAGVDDVVLPDVDTGLEVLLGCFVVLGLVEVVAVLEERSGVLDDAVVVLHVVDVDLEVLLAVVVELLRLRDFDEAQQGSAHLAHDLMLLVEPHLVGLSSHKHLLLLLVFVQLHLLQDIDRVFLLLGLDEDSAGDDAVKQVLEVFLGLAGPGEEVLLELVVVLVGVLLVDLHGGEGELSAVDECALELLVAKVVERESALLHALLHQRLQPDHVPQEAVLAHAGVGLEHRRHHHFLLIVSGGHYNLNMMLSVLQYLPELQSMLRQLCRTLLSPAHSLKRCIYSRPEEIEWLRGKFYANPKFVDKFEYLQRLQREKNLGNFFGNKQVDLLSQEEIYFLFNSDMEYKVDERGKQQLMAKLSSTYFKCLIAKEFRWVNDIFQCLIALNFNEELSQMPPYEISFCLEIIAEFQNVHSIIDKNKLHHKLMRHVDQEEHIYNMILISGYLLEMNITMPELHNSHKFVAWFKGNTNFDFRVIYFLHKLSEKVGYVLSEDEKAKLNNHMKEAIKKFQVNYFENNYLVFLLQYYPEYVNNLNILHFTPRAYVGYLLFYKQNPQNKISPHRIPQSVVELASVFTFRAIIEYRMSLSLDNALTLAKALPDFFSHSLKPVNCFISYLRENKIDDPQVEFYVEKAVQAKLKLNQQFSKELMEAYSLNEIIALFAHLNRDRKCSVHFWKKAVRLLEKLIQLNRQAVEANKLLKSAKVPLIIQSRSETYVNLLSIAASKNFKEESREAIYLELINLLSQSRNEWPVKSLLKITRILAIHRIGEDEIWLLIERRIIKYVQSLKSAKEGMGEALKENLVRLILSFNSMEKGSFQFWHEMNDSLDGKTKKQALLRVKTLNSLAHTHLKPFLN